jgi:predicted small lipoprotein YifL
MRPAARVALIALAAAAATGCGLKGPLYLPEKPGAVTTRPGPAKTAPEPAPESAAPAGPATPVEPAAPPEPPPAASDRTGG